ncbi:hypothetical protein BVX94_02080 [bacterium B17]|nr:hypothetical protein BVX94_02080 [bacterium B17]
MSKIETEKRTVSAMIDIFCRDKHASKKDLCVDCLDLTEYAMMRLDKCPFGEQKPKCSDCEVHCYKPERRDLIKQVMRHSGPRMALKHPVMAIKHALKI